MPLLTAQAGNTMIMFSISSLDSVAAVVTKLTGQKQKHAVQGLLTSLL